MRTKIQKRRVGIKTLPLWSNIKRKSEWKESQRLERSFQYLNHLYIFKNEWTRDCRCYKVTHTKDCLFSGKQRGSLVMVLVLCLTRVARGLNGTPNGVTNGRDRRWWTFSIDDKTEESTTYSKRTRNGYMRKHTPKKTKRNTSLKNYYLNKGTYLSLDNSNKWRRI